MTTQEVLKVKKLQFWELSNITHNLTRDHAIFYIDIYFIYFMYKPYSTVSSIRCKYDNRGDGGL